MELNIQERLTLVNIVPEKGNFETMSMVETLRKLLYPSEKEVGEFEITQDNHKVYWNNEGNKRIEIPLSSAHIKLFKRQLEQLSEKDSLDSNQYSIFKRLREIEN